MVRPKQTARVLTSGKAPLKELVTAAARKARPDGEVQRMGSFKPSTVALRKIR